MKKIFLLLCITGTMLSCTKDENPATPEQEPGYGNRIKFVLQDNLDFKAAVNSLTYAGSLDSLAVPGPFTFLAPDNTAFARVNVYTDYMIFTYFTAQRMKNMLQYYTLKGSISFAALPVGTDTAFVTVNDKHVYVKKFTNGTDTTVTVNGIKIEKADIYASNGGVNAIVTVMNPEIYTTVVDFVHDNSYVTMFNVALQHSGLDSSLLSGKMPYTVLAPSNEAFKATAGNALDLSTIEKIMQTDPAKLADVLKYHILPGRVFEGDFYRAPNATVTMLNNEPVTISGYEPSYNNISFTDINGNQGAIYVQKEYNPSINNADNVCGNGVVFIITALLIP